MSQFTRTNFERINPVEDSSFKSRALSQNSTYELVSECLWPSSFRVSRRRLACASVNECDHFDRVLHKCGQLELSFSESSVSFSIRDHILGKRFLVFSFISSCSTVWSFVKASLRLIASSHTIFGHLLVSSAALAALPRIFLLLL